MYNIVINGITKLIKSHNKYFRNYCQSSKHNLKPPWNILFFGTDEFSVASLKAIYGAYKKGDLLNNLEVVTSLKNKKNPVEKFALEKKLILHDWPVSVSECDRFHIGLVVSFGHLIPEDVINTFPLGMLNVHASLLPRWRGAAPIIYAIANGDEKTGITIMAIKPHKFDIGEIIQQASVEIPYRAKMPDLYMTLANLGAQILVKTLREMPSNLKHAIPQPKYGATFAPKVTSAMARVNWDKMSARCVYNLNRALTGMFQLTTTFNEFSIKLYNITECNKNRFEDSTTNKKIVPGSVTYCKESKLLKIECMDGNWINVEKVGVPGKKIMSAAEFNNGYINKQLQHLRKFS